MSAFIFWILALIGGGIIGVFLFVLIGVAFSALPGVGLGKIRLNCPHCGAETPATDSECHHCLRSFREESTIPRPVIDSPKVPARH